MEIPEAPLKEFPNFRPSLGDPTAPARWPRDPRPSVHARMRWPWCTSCHRGSPTTTRFTRTRLSDIVHPVSSSQLAEIPDRVRSFGGDNMDCQVATK